MARIKAFLDRYGKALVPAAVAVVTAAQAPLTDNRITTQEAIAFLLAVNAAVTVYVVPILHYRHLKTLVGVINSVLMALATVIIGGISWHDTTELVLAALLAVGVTAARAESTAVAGQTFGEVHGEPVADTTA